MFVSVDTIYSRSENISATIGTLAIVFALQAKFCEFILLVQIRLLAELIFGENKCIRMDLHRVARRHVELGQRYVCACLLFCRTDRVVSNSITMMMVDKMTRDDQTK